MGEAVVDPPSAGEPQAWTEERQSSVQALAHNLTITAWAPDRWPYPETPEVLLMRIGAKVGYLLRSPGDPPRLTVFGQPRQHFEPWRIGLEPISEHPFPMWAAEEPNKSHILVRTNDADVHVIAMVTLEETSRIAGSLRSFS